MSPSCCRATALFWLATASWSARAAPEILLDTGRDEDRRHYQSIENCRSATPCVLTQNGALKFNIDDPGRYEFRLWMMSRRFLYNIDFFEKRAAADYEVVERMFNRRKNRGVWSLLDRVEQGKLDMIYMYGVTLQYKLDSGDPIIFEVTDKKNPDVTEVYYLRYHRAGFWVHFDVALVFPINAVRVPDPDPPYRNNTLSGAATLSLKRAKDPEADYSWFDKIVLSFYPTIFLGVLKRELDRGEELNAREQTDLFVGAGVTFLDVFFAGWGANLINEPRTSNPFVGVHLGKALRFGIDINRTSPSKWDEYLEEEQAREAAQKREQQLR